MIQTPVNNGLPTNRNTLLIFFLSLSLLLFEISIIRLFSVLLVSKLSFLSITIALFGVAIGGLFSYLYFSVKAGQEQKIIQKLLLFYAATVVLFLALSVYVPVGRAILPIFLVLFAAFPFIVGNIVLTIIFKNNNSHISRLYFADLMGAGLGVAVAIFLMSVSSAINAILVSALLGLVAAWINGGSRTIKKVNIILTILSVVFIFCNHWSPFFKLHNSKGHNLANIEFSKWNSFSFITAENRIGHIDSMSTKYKGLPSNIGIWIDGDAYTSIVKFDGDFSKVDFLRHDLLTAAYQYASSGQALIIGPGGGRDVLSALLFQNKVRGVDINPIIVNDLLGKKYAEYSGQLYQQPNTEIIVAEGRAFIKKDRSLYDFINIPLVDTWSSTASGNLMLVESNLYTLEAMTEYLKHLKSSGTLSVMRWELDGQRLMPLYFTAAKQLDLQNPSQNVVVIANGNLNNYLFKIEPFTTEELAKLEKFAEDNNFTIIYNPQRSDGRGDYYEIFKILNRGEALQIWKGRNLSLVYDDGPFYFFQTPVQDIFLNTSNRLDGGLGQAFLITLFLTAIILFLPFYKIYKRKVLMHDRRVYFYTAYFATLGLAFIMIEISLIQKFVVYLEKPIYSYSVVLATLLIAAGLGSRFTNRLDRQKIRTYFVAAFCLLLLALIYRFLLPEIIGQSIGWEIKQKILLAILVTAPISFMIGLFLPMGFYKVEKDGLNFSLPWFWAVNGAFSVLGSVLAVLFAIMWNFYAVFIFGAALYIPAAFFMWLTGRQSMESEIISE